MDIQIYKWTCSITGKSYIGQTSDGERREYAHFNCARNGCVDCDHSSLFHEAIRKYGEENFDKEILELTDQDRANEIEDYFITAYDTLMPNGYNRRFNSRRNYPIGDEEVEYEMSNYALDSFEIRGGGGSVHERRIKETPEWVNDDAVVRAVLTKAFPKLHSSPRHRAKAGRWLRVIQEYYRMGRTLTVISKELGLTVNALNQLTMRIRKTRELV
jgi:group I intron endonuclease